GPSEATGRANPARPARPPCRDRADDCVPGFAGGQLCDRRRLRDRRRPHRCLMMIVDVHTHVGLSLNSGVDISEEALLAAMARYGIDLSLVMPQPRPDMQVIETHDRIAGFAEANPGRILGIVNISPLVDQKDYRRETKRCIAELG